MSMFRDSFYFDARWEEIKKYFEEAVPIIARKILGIQTTHETIEQ